MKKRVTSLAAEIIWLLCFLVLVAVAPTFFAKELLLAICVLLAWLYMPNAAGGTKK